jgi:hypothetical protein
MAVHLVSCPTSESDAGRILSELKDLAALYGMRFGIPGLDARIRCHRNEEGTST